MKTRSGIQLDYYSPNVNSQNPNASDKTLSTGTATTKNWTFQENEAYVEFLVDHEKMMKTSGMRRSTKIFLEMSLFIHSKFPEQCRTHHQKVLAKYGTIENIISFYLGDQAKKLKPVTPLPIKYELLKENSDYQILKESSRLAFLIKILKDPCQQL